MLKLHFLFSVEETFQTSEGKAAFPSSHVVIRSHVSASTNLILMQPVSKTEETKTRLVLVIVMSAVLGLCGMTANLTSKSTPEPSPRESWCHRVPRFSQRPMGR